MTEVVKLLIKILDELRAIRAILENEGRSVDRLTGRR